MSDLIPRKQYDNAACCVEEPCTGVCMSHRFLCRERHNECRLFDAIVLHIATGNQMPCS